MARLALDTVAWASRWRTRSVAEKALLSLGLLVVAVTAPSPIVSVAVLVTAVTIALIGARVPARGYLLALFGPASFIVLGALVIAVQVGTPAADALWSWWLLAVTPDSLGLAAQVASRSVASFAVVLLLAATTPMTDILAGLRRLHVPEALVEIAGLMYRMLFALLGAATAIMEAQRSRLGYVNGRAARRSVGALGGAVLRQAWLRAQRLEAGLEGRGSTGSLRTLTLARPVSLRFVLVSGALVAALGVLSMWTTVAS